MHSRSWSLYSALVLSLVLCISGCSKDGAVTRQPDTQKQPVSNTYHGTTITEDYRWLEDFEDSTVREWSDAQDDFARAYLDGRSQRKQIQERLEELYSEPHPSYYSLRPVAGKLFAMKDEPPHEQPFLVYLESVHDPGSQQVIIDLNTLDTTYTTAIDFYVPSLDGRLVAVSLSRRGSEHGTVYVYDVASGKKHADEVPRVNGPTAGGSVAWNPDGSGFHYTRYPHEGERPDEDLSFYQQVYYHRLGTPHTEDTYAIGEEFPRIAEIDLECSHDGKYICAVVSYGDGGEYAHYLNGPRGPWHQITDFSDRATRARFGPDGALYLLSFRGAPRGQILRLGPGATELNRARTIVEEGPATIREFLPTASHLYVVDIHGGPSRVRIYDPRGKLLDPWPVEPIASIGSLRSTEDDRILFTMRSYTEPAAWYEYDPATEKTQRTALFTQSSADYSQVEVVREFATSKDGTKIPINILRNRGIELGGSHPTILYGYGGYGISQTPYHSTTNSLWLNQGGVYAIANLRGGGEYGEEWHLAGNLTVKQNVFDDFIACAEFLIERGYTQPSKLAIEGGSNGGLLMGAALTQRPDLFRAVVSRVGIYDMLRVELDPNGEFNTTEFGTVNIPEHFAALHAYSPYHNVNDGTAYPAVLFTTGQHDGRVNPAHSRKMTARLQAATASDHPILLRTSAQTGHGSGTSRSRRIARYTDVYSFLFSELGMEYQDQPEPVRGAGDSALTEDQSLTR